MILIAGTVPAENLDLIQGKVEKIGNSLKVQDYTFPCGQGTGAMISSCLEVTKALGLEPPYALLAGDIGRGQGTRRIYQYLIEQVTNLKPRILALHYCLPIVRLMQKLCEALKECSYRPLLIADAGAMYAAKAAGVAPQFDIFTPDPSEMAFLADPEAVHPAYVSRYLFEALVHQVPELIKRAYAHGGAAKILLVKGAIDYIATEGRVVARIEEPCMPELECIGGTGDTITGMVAALTGAGYDPLKAVIVSAQVNRLAGRLSCATPATRVDKLIEYIPVALRELGVISKGP
ncbi:MAG: sugar kinase [Thermanaeromonas sp.]|uniref:NAD(P)H-hydrate dehydratase n=1 Tax=Thermanaeromonas sp. TaxID=2003697 RepID=UPI002437D2E6|nr:NAD(P)H-hydrate dehydratase [Thermanaeromonas sp.]MCG0278440.1 sugar kinase [Thermanaeromonas sp.]